MVVISRTVGKELNSSGFRMNTAVIRIRIEKVIENASAMSSSHAGSGRISTTRIARMPMASANFAVSEVVANRAEQARSARLAGMRWRLAMDS